MPSVYPSSITPRVIDPAGDGTLAERIIAAREATPRATKAQLVGGVLQGSDDVRGFERVWDEVEAERVAMIRVLVADHATLTQFKTALSKCGDRLDADTWVDALKDVAGVLTWTDLKALADEVIVAEL